MGDGGSMGRTGEGAVGSFRQKRMRAGREDRRLERMGGDLGCARWVRFGPPMGHRWTPILGRKKSGVARMERGEDRGSKMEDRLAGGWECAVVGIVANWAGWKCVTGE